MQIVSLHIKNFMGISEVEFMPGKITQITGGNSQGKTTMLKAIEAGIKGSTDGSLVKFGEDAAEIIIELPENLLIRRRITVTGNNTVKVTRDGMSPQAPQAYLNALFASSSFNPNEVLNPKERNASIMKSIPMVLTAEKLSELSGVPVAELPELDYKQHGLKIVDAAHAYFYQKRAEANKDALNKKNRLEAFKKELTPLPEEKPDREAIQKRLDELKELQKVKDDKLKSIDAEIDQTIKAQETVARYEEAAEKIVEKIDKLNSSIREKKAHLQNKMEEILARHRKELADAEREHNDEVNDLKKQLASEEGRIEQSKIYIEEARAAAPTTLPDKPAFVADSEANKKEILKQEGLIKDCDGYDAQLKSHDFVNTLEKEHQEAKAIADSVAARVEKLAGPVKKALMETAEMPVAGLEYKDGQFLVEGVPVDNLSTSKAMMLALGVAKKLCGKTKFICIDGAEAFDQETWELFLKLTENDGYQYFVTKVGTAFDNSEPKEVIYMDKGEAIHG